MQLSQESIALGLLILRVILGVVFFAHGAQKVLGWFGGYGLKGTVGYFKNALHIPTPIGYIGAFTEFLGGLALIAGLETRLAGLGLVIMMLVATYKAHWKIGFFMNWGSQADRGEGFEYSLTLAVVTLALVVMGAGAYSLDAIL